MAEYISCRSCDSKSCTGCNMLILERMLDRGKFDCLMDKHHTIIPVADVVNRKRGRWIWDERFHDYTCSECHNWDLKTPNYCSNCGADMREVVDHA